MRAVRFALTMCAVWAATPFAVKAEVDLSGVWRSYTEPGAQRVRGSAFATPLPLKPEAQAKVAEYQALVSPLGETPGGMCLGTGMPGSMMGSGGYPMEIMQRPNQINIIYEAHNEIRRIYLGEQVLAPDDRLPDRNGYSVGRWENDRLIVTTDSLKEAVDQRYPHSANAKLTEEYSLSPDGEVLTAKLTIEDPDWYTSTFTAEKKWRLDRTARLMPYECNEPLWEARLEELRANAAAARSGQ